MSCNSPLFSSQYAPVPELHRTFNMIIGNWHPHKFSDLGSLVDQDATVVQECIATAQQEKQENIFENFQLFSNKEGEKMREVNR